MQLLKKTILAGIFAVLLPVGLYAQMEEEIYPEDSFPMQNSQEEEFEEDGFLSWASFMLNLEHESQETTYYTDIYHTFTDAFTKEYGISPEKAPVGSARLRQFRAFYANHKGDYGGELLLPTLAIWNQQPLLSIVPLPDRLDAYWGNPQAAADTYDFMASIDHEATLYFMGQYMGSFYGHPKTGKELKNFWNNWAGRKNSFAKQDIVALKRAMLKNILAHDDKYAVMELASGQKNALWPQLYLQPIPQEQQRVQEIISSVCMDENPTKDCAWFVHYAETYKYIVNEEVQQKVASNFHNNVNIVVMDPIYNDYWLYSRTWAPSWTLYWYFDYWYPYYYRYNVIYDPFFTYHIYPWYWFYRPNYPGWHNHIYIGHRPHHPPHGHFPGYRPWNHRPNYHGHHPHVGNPGARPHRPGSNMGGNHRPNPHQGGVGNPGGRPGSHGGNQPGSTGRRPGHGNHGGNGGQPGHNPGGDGGHGNHGGNGGQPGHNPGGNNGNMGGNNGHQHPSIINTNPKADKPTAVEKQGNVTRVNPGATKKPSSGSPVTPGNRSSRSSFGASYPTTPTPNNSGSVTTKRPAGNMNHGNIDRATSGSRPSPGISTGGSSRSYSGSTPSRSSGSHATPSRPSGSYSAPSRASGGSFGGSSRSYGGSSGGSSRPSFGGASSGGSGSSGRFSGGSHGGSSSGSRGGASGGSRGGSHGGRR